MQIWVSFQQIAKIAPSILSLDNDEFLKNPL